MACERFLSRLACKSEVWAMSAMVATSMVPVGRLVCACFHSSAQPIRQPGRGKVDRVGMSPIVILSLCPETRMAHWQIRGRYVQSRLLAHRDNVAAKRKLARPSQDFERCYLCTDGRGINKFQRVSCSNKRIQKSLSITNKRADEFGHKFKKNPLRLVFSKAGHHQRFSSLDVYFSHIRAQPETAKNFIGPPH